MRTPFSAGEALFAHENLNRVQTGLSMGIDVSFAAAAPECAIPFGSPFRMQSRASVIRQAETHSARVPQSFENREGWTFLL
jgi:hypothetical protein